MWILALETPRVLDTPGDGLPAFPGTYEVPDARLVDLAPHEDLPGSVAEGAFFGRHGGRSW